MGCLNILLSLKQIRIQPSDEQKKKIVSTWVKILRLAKVGQGTEKDLA